MHLPPPSKPPPSYSRLFCFLTASRALAPHNPFSPSRHHDTPKMHLTSCCFSAWYCSVTSSLLHLLKTQIPTTGSRTDPAPFPASPARLCQPGPATLPLLFLEWALPKGICTCGSFCLESTFFDLILEGSFLSFGFQLKYHLITEAFKHTGVPQATHLISLISSWFCF